MPVKNEDWILESTLQNIAPHVDLVIIADQNSTDRSIEICNKFSNVQVINNPKEGHDNTVRWLLLEEARKIGKNNLIICLDADELISPQGIEEMKKNIIAGQATKGDVFKLRWIQLWKGVEQYRNDGVWKNNFKNTAFIDNEGVNEYKKELIINDHTSRVPNTKINKEILISYPLLHLHFVPWNRTQLKQAWYRCRELTAGQRNAKRINNTYRVTLEPKNVKIEPITREWIGELTFPKNLENISSNWHLESILSLFNKYGIEFFEKLQIWHISDLRAEFIKKVGREPKSQVYPKWLTVLNEIKNKIRNL